MRAAKGLAGSWADAAFSISGTQCLCDPARCLLGGSLQGVVVKVGVDRGRGEPPVSKQPAHSGEAHAVPDALRGPSVPAVMDMQTGQSGFLADDATEHIEAMRCEDFGKNSLRAVGAGQRPDQLRRFWPEP